ncbi:unnamed protein product [Protopolystoma xenopodis]|uniref:Uncharacterized protein n=1 Tax=Protopolystoma xenopodis TaxID=117903 RepID=A0A448WFE0_9PLAT|nr:unnamed protein product [Protopolystoma xenopodis]
MNQQLISCTPEQCLSPSVTCPIRPCGDGALLSYFESKVYGSEHACQDSNLLSPAISTSVDRKLDSCHACSSLSICEHAQLHLNRQSACLPQSRLDFHAAPDYHHCQPRYSQHSHKRYDHCSLDCSQSTCCCHFRQIQSKNGLITPTCGFNCRLHTICRVCRKSVKENGYSATQHSSNRRKLHHRHQNNPHQVCCCPTHLVAVPLKTDVRFSETDCTSLSHALARPSSWYVLLCLPK